MPIGVNWDDIWAPVWKQVWQTEDVSTEPTIFYGDAQTFRDEPEASLLLIGIAYYRTQHVRDQ